MSGQDLRALSDRTVPGDAEMPGFDRNGDVRVIRASKGGQFGQEIDSATVVSVNPNSLDKTVSEHVIHLDQPAWQLMAVSPGNLLWALDKGISLNGKVHISAYALQNGKRVATREVLLSEARIGVAETGTRPRGRDLPPPTAIPQPGGQSDAPQLAQIIAMNQTLLGVFNQPVVQWKSWSRVMILGVPAQNVAWSSVLNDCDVALDAVGRAGRMAVGSCDLLGRVFFDQYAIKKSEAVFISTQNASIVATLPLNNRRPPLSLAIDDTPGEAVAAIYDRLGVVRVIAIPQ